MAIQNAEPIFDVAQLAHVKIYSPKPQETLDFFTGILEMCETGREGQSVYLRATRTRSTTPSRSRRPGRRVWATCVQGQLPSGTGPDRGRARQAGISQAYFLYVFEPGGNRVELFGDVGYLIFDPNWKPIVWGEEDVDTSIIWFGSPLPDSYFTTGSPDVGRAEESEDEELVEAVDEVSRESSKVGRGPNPDA